MELYIQMRFPYKFDRETIVLKDGGTIALDWVFDHEGGAPIPSKRSSRPILIFVPGLSGGNNNLYIYSMLKSAINDPNVANG